MNSKFQPPAVGRLGSQLRLGMFPNSGWECCPKIMEQKKFVTKCVHKHNSERCLLGFTEMTILSVPQSLLSLQEHHQLLWVNHSL